MPYIGHEPTNAGSFIEIDDFSSTFNGANDSGTDVVAFTLQVGGVDITPNTANVLVMLDGVLQQPPASYSISGSTLTFTEAPASGTDLYAVLIGQSASVGQGTITAAELAISGNGTNNQLLKTDGDGTFSYINQNAITGITSVGTIGTGVWQGTKVASAYLDDDTAHLSSTQTFTGDKTFSDNVLITTADNDTTTALKVLALDDGGYTGTVLEVYGTRGPTADYNIAKFGTNASTAKIVFDGVGNVGIGHATPSNFYYKGLSIGDGGSGDKGLTIYGSAWGALAFADGTSGDARYEGYVAYNQSSNQMLLATAHTTALTLDNSQNATFAGNMYINKADPTLYLNSASTQQENSGRIVMSEHASGANDYFEIYHDGSANELVIESYEKDDILKIARTTGNATFVGNILRSGSGDTTITNHSTGSGDPSFILDSAAANRNGFLHFKDQGSQAGYIKYLHNGDSMNFHTGNSGTADLTLSGNATFSSKVQAPKYITGEVSVSSGSSGDVTMGSSRMGFWFAHCANGNNNLMKSGTFYSPNSAQGMYVQDLTSQNAGNTSGMAIAVSGVGSNAATALRFSPTGGNGTLVVLSMGH